MYDMKKLMVVLSSLLVASSMLFAASGDSKNVEISTTIDKVVEITVNKTSTYSVATGDVVEGAGLDEAFYVNTKTNNGAGITVTYKMSALKGQADGNTQVIPVDVYLGATKDKTFSASTAEDGTANVISRSSADKMVYDSTMVTVKPTNTTWQDDVKADTYRADITFTIAAN
jgi:hypothetical protein